MLSLDPLEQHLDLDEGSKVHYRNGRYYPYVDTAGKLTIGMGRNLTDCGLSEDEKQLMARNDLAACVAAAQQYSWFNQLDDARQGVVVMMIFNMGAPTFAEFHYTQKAIAEGRYDDAAAGMAGSRWNTQVGHRAAVYEQIMRTGVWQ